MTVAVSNRQYACGVVGLTLGALQSESFHDHVSKGPRYPCLAPDKAIKTCAGKTLQRRNDLDSTATSADDADSLVFKVDARTFVTMQFPE